ncbi:hypothetical protein [Falsiroseomonas sp.]|uniref:hypothetical protein n=1 Tax=Falsiroseomonas sp. TaxID=2870721 RepID=UPI003F6E48EE
MGLAACGAPGPAAVAEPPQAAAQATEDGWMARRGDGTCVLEAGQPARKVQFVVRPARVAFAMGRFDRDGPRLDPASTAEILFAGPQGAWSLPGLPVAPQAFGRSLEQAPGLEMVRATLAGGSFRTPQLDVAFAVPPAGQAGEAFLDCVAALPAASAPRGATGQLKLF